MEQVVIIGVPMKVQVILHRPDDEGDDGSRHHSDDDRESRIFGTVNDGVALLRHD